MKWLSDRYGVSAEELLQGLDRVLQEYARATGLPAKPALIGLRVVTLNLQILGSCFENVCRCGPHCVP